MANRHARQEANMKYQGSFAVGFFVCVLVCPACSIEATNAQEQHVYKRKVLLDYEDPKTGRPAEIEVESSVPPARQNPLHYESLLRIQHGFPQSYRLYEFGNMSWSAAKLAVVTIQEDGSARVSLNPGNKSLSGLTMNEAKELWGIGCVNLCGESFPGHTYSTYHLQALVDAEPTIYHLDIDFDDQKCVRYRIRGQKISPKWIEVAKD